jgi:hypothetical protein
VAGQLAWEAGGFYKNCTADVLNSAPEGEIGHRRDAHGGPGIPEIYEFTIISRHSGRQTLVKP